MTTWNETMIARAISQQTLQRRCLLLVNNCNWTGHECDVLGVTLDLRIIDIEIKISRADLKADAKKEKWWRRAYNWPFESEYSWQHGAPAPDQRLIHPAKVWKHYYAMPIEIWKPELIDSLASPASGILLLSQGNGYTSNGVPLVTVRVQRRAIPNRNAERLQPTHVMDIARLANLRMWESYQKVDEMRNEMRSVA
ncbi:hypothetical protein FHW67_002737 [Herbaspirillum sp. Sphag1AN]|uniref:hypothetical protein n=1 Tax=unclassified Herbaspirillum TaxID=2624150 RepID=UPI001622B7DB|nr:MULTISPECIES: hypothetical protein [unclassified Herbaspirillum]MBB3213445.1 hypothetical protein [Herbaspirillum sp. Sphag1AN]MBB3246511.1 hypothetical protein [Herbaspirillum sp. Sphag64]